MGHYVVGFRIGIKVLKKILYPHLAFRESESETRWHGCQLGIDIAVNSSIIALLTMISERKGHDSPLEM